MLAALLPGAVAVAAPAMQVATPTPAPTTTNPLDALIKNLPTIKKLIAQIQQQSDARQVRWINWR